jgi:hypothetical protein
MGQQDKPKQDGTVENAQKPQDEGKAFVSDPAKLKDVVKPQEASEPVEQDSSEVQGAGEDNEPEFPKKVRTTFEPDTEITVNADEYLVLERQGLLAK